MEGIIRRTKLFYENEKAEGTVTVNMILYGVAGMLTIFIIFNIAKSQKFTTGDAIAVLGILVSIILALNLPSRPQIEPGDDPIMEAAEDTTLIAGNWAGVLISDTESFSAELEISIRSGCSVGGNCGTFTVQEIGCSGYITLVGINDKDFTFREQEVDDTCGGGLVTITFLAQNALSWTFERDGVRSHASLGRK